MKNILCIMTCFSEYTRRHMAFKIDIEMTQEKTENNRQKGMGSDAYTDNHHNSTKHNKTMIFFGGTGRSTSH